MPVPASDARRRPDIRSNPRAIPPASIGSGGCQSASELAPNNAITNNLIKSNGTPDGGVLDND
jgi:hypothetical protein